MRTSDWARRVMAVDHVARASLKSMLPASVPRTSAPSRSVCAWSLGKSTGGVMEQCCTVFDREGPTRNASQGRAGGQRDRPRECAERKDREGPLHETQETVLVAHALQRELLLITLPQVGGTYSTRRACIRASVPNGARSAGWRTARVARVKMVAQNVRAGWIAHPP